MNTKPKRKILPAPKPGQISKAKIRKAIIKIRAQRQNSDEPLELKGFALANKILEEVSAQYGIPKRTLQSSHKRSRTVVEARHYAIYRIDQETTLSQVEISDVLHCDHANVWVVLKKMNDKE